MLSKRALRQFAPPTPPAGTAIVTDPLEIRRLLIRAATGHTAVSLKIRKAPGDEETVLQGSLLDSEGLQIKLAVPLKRSLPAGCECMLLIYLQGRSILGIHATPSANEGDRIHFALPKRLFKIQRRKSVRFQIPAAYEFTVELGSPRRMTKRIFDVSEDGISFFVQPSEVELLPRGLLLHSCVIRIHNQRIKTSLKIRNHKPARSGTKSGGFQIGAEFEDILPEDRDYIAQFVYSNASHLFY